MGINVTPDSSETGAMCTAHVKYGGDVPPMPNDVHIDAKHDDGTWYAVTGYESIPAGMDPAAGFDIRFSGGNPNVGGPGERHFRVRWTFDGEPLGEPEETSVKLGVVPSLSWWERFKRWWKNRDWSKVVKTIFDVLGALGKAKRDKDDHQ